MRKHIVAFFLLLSSALSLVCCDNEEEDGGFYWEQTKCADPWGTGENDSNQATIRELEIFLKDNGIVVLGITFDNNSTLDVLCESCGCGTGQRIIVTVPESDAAEIQDLGFIEV